MNLKPYLFDRINTFYKEYHIEIFSHMNLVVIKEVYKIIS